jgi:hypothetical protein
VTEHLPSKCEALSSNPSGYGFKTYCPKGTRAQTSEKDLGPKSTADPVKVASLSLKLPQI